MTTRYDVEQAGRDLTPGDIIYLVDGPRQGQHVLAPGHVGKLCLGLAPNMAPRMGAELVYRPVPGMRTSEGARCYEFAPLYDPISENPHSS